MMFLQLTQFTAYHTRGNFAEIQQYCQRSIWNVKDLQRISCARSGDKRRNKRDATRGTRKTVACSDRKRQEKSEKLARQQNKPGARRDQPEARHILSRSGRKTSSRRRNGNKWKTQTSIKPLESKLSGSFPGSEYGNFCLRGNCCFGTSYFLTTALSCRLKTWRIIPRGYSVS